MPAPAIDAGRPLGAGPGWLAAGAMEWVAAGAVLLALLAHGLVRVPCDDIGSHMATARLALDTGSWPVVNTFSAPHRDFPLYCQYPAFETLVHSIYRLGGWSGLSVGNALVWLAVFLLFARWSGPFRLAAALHLPWMFGLMALQRRMMLRPEMASMLMLGASLLLMDAYLRGRRGAAVWLPVVHVVWVNAHQLFTVSLAVQALLVAHILLSRWGRLGVDTRDAGVPILPVLLAFAGSVLATGLTPLGLDIAQAPLWTADTLGSHRHHVQEFAYIWQRPLDLQLALACAAFALAALWIGRRRWLPLDVGVLLLALALTALVMRGLVFLSLVSVAVLARTLARHPPSSRIVAQVRPAFVRAVRAGMAALTLALAGNILYHRWVAPPLSLRGTQPGLGRTRGDWPDAAIAALRADPPPGQMMNMPWSIASPLIWYAPELPTFVDARFETFPRQFLVDAIRSYRDDAVLDRLVAEHRPAWIFAEHCWPDVRARIARLAGQRAWGVTYADAQIAVLVRRTPATDAYLARRRLALPEREPRDLLASPLDLRVQQRRCYAALLGALGWTADARRHGRLADGETQAGASAP